MGAFDEPPDGPSTCPAGSACDPGDRGDPIVCDADALNVTDTPLRRLSHTEYRFTLRDLLAGIAMPELQLIADESVHGFENNARALSSSSLLVEQYDGNAYTLARAIARADAGERQRVLGCWAEPGEADALSCGHTFVADFGRRLFRRPLDEEERTEYETFFDGHFERDGFEVAARLVMQAMLQAPQFIYRLEFGTSGSGELLAISDFELATRLSYFLWSSAPDEELLSAAGAGMLAERGEREVQVRRMLADPRARASVVDFHRQWLEFDAVEHERKDPERFPMVDAELIEGMRRELDRFVEHTVFDGEGTLSSLLLDRTTFVNGPLAELYGVESPSSPEDSQRQLPGDERAGILTRAAVMAGHSRQLNASPPLRGVFVMERLLCNSSGAPPADIDLSRPEPIDGPATNRELFTQLTSPPNCISCHQEIDGLGYGFENYDAIGAFQTVEAPGTAGEGLDIDASGWLANTDIDGDYNGALELSERLAQSRQVERCMTVNLLRYANGRDATREDSCTVNRLTARFGESGGDIQELMVAIAMQEEFRYRRAGE